MLKCAIKVKAYNGRKNWLQIFFRPGNTGVGWKNSLAYISEQFNKF